jgi:hypothetical protein
MKVLLYTVTTVLVALVTFFGIGPAILADGSTTERLMVIAAVIVLYIIIFFAFRVLRKRLP